MTRKYARKNKSLLEYDFTKGFCDKHFISVLGTDGCITTDGDGLTVNSKVFTSSHPRGEMGWLNCFKWCSYYYTPIECSRSKETMFEAVIANKQFFGDKATPFPRTFGPRVRDMFADPRLSHGQFSIIDPKTGVWAGFLLTDHTLYAVYGCLPDGSVCKHHNKYATECEPCKASCDTKYGCDNFWQDCRYLDFKQNATEKTFRCFQEFLPWCAFTKYNNVDMYNWQVFCEWRKRHAINCDAYSRQDFVAWKSHHEWDEYCCFANWDSWYKQYKDWEKCSDAKCAPSCNQGECSKRLLGGDGSGDSCNPCGCMTCYHHYEDGKNCYSAGDAKPADEKYSYEWDACRNCCCASSAVFVDMIPLQCREACDPLCDWVKVAVGVDRRYHTINFYVDNQLCHQVVGTGRRQHDQYRVRENGGYAKTVDMYKVLVAFGTGDMLDAQLPDNYSRFRAKEDYINMTGLVPLLPDSYYRQTYFNKLGELQTIDPKQTFAGTGSREERLFLQGDIFKIQCINVFTKAPTRGYRSLVSLCPNDGCCAGGPPNGYYGSQSGRLHSNECPPLSDCTPDCSDDDECCADGYCSPDERNYRIEFEQPQKPSLCDASGNQVSRTITTQARLVRTPRSKRYWEPNCASGAFGRDPYC
jgi:hypothetical protein